MNEASSIIAQSAIKSQGSVLPPREKLFTNRKTFADYARFLWPQKTAANLAVEAGVSERAAKYWLAGQDPSPRAVAALFARVAADINQGGN